MTSATRSFRAHCHCKKIQLQFSVPTSSLPLPSHTCHCDTCRRLIGNLALFTTKLPSAPSPDPRTLSDLSAYRALPESDVLRFFCSTCGTQLINLAEEDEDWYLSTSCVSEVGDEENIFEYRDAVFVPCSIDGGLSDWLPEGTRKWESFTGLGQPLEDDSWKRPAAPAVEGKRDALDVHCQCRGVSFTISRPDYGSEAFRKDFPKLKLPPEDPMKRNIEEERENGTWCIASNRSKYMGSTCLCTSDRLSTGCEMMQWAFVPTTFITLADGSPYRSEFGTLKAFQSSKDIFRRFCGTCGASVFWHDIRERPHMIDVAVGVLDSETGARAEDWLEWRKKSPSYAEDAVNKRLARELSEGYMKWVSKR